LDGRKLTDTLQSLVDLSPRGIREHLKLNRPIYARTAAYGHFGRAPEPDGGFSWERMDLVPALRSAHAAR
jgi:S-adenosylmethionine synthetase